MSISRRDLLWMPMAAPLAAMAQKAGAKTNVLVIAVDDLNNRIGCYGDPIVKTPNIDRLAGHGVRFDHSYCNYPVCNASRTSLLSGKRPETTQVLGNTTPPRTTLGNVAFLPEHFKANGFFTARVGKIAHGTYEGALKWDNLRERGWSSFETRRRRGSIRTQGQGREESRGKGRRPNGRRRRRQALLDADRPSGRRGTRWRHSAAHRAASHPAQERAVLHRLRLSQTTSAVGRPS